MINFGNTVIFAAHPDDEVLGAGGTIPALKSLGIHVTVVIVTDGSTTQYEDASVHKSKKQSLIDANNILGTDDLITLDFPDMRLDTVEHVVLNKAIEEVLDLGDFETVLVHHRGDINMDHRLIYDSLMVAARPVPNQHVRNILSYQVNSSTEWGDRTLDKVFLPNFYIDITETIDKKIEAFECYSDELRPYPHPRSPEALRYRAAVYGTEIGFNYAEAFQIILSRVSAAD